MDEAAAFRDAPREEIVFAARLRPHRSLSRVGAGLVLSLAGVMSLVTGFIFWMRGAWPVVGFAGLDVLVMWLAFRASFRSARIFEELRLTPNDLVHRRVGLDGAEDVWRVNPVWVRLMIDRDSEGEVTALSLAYRGERRPLALFLGPEERADFASALSRALAEVRAGPRYPSLMPA
jgi:uncharacterized membrane protein